MNAINLNDEQTETLWKRARDSGMTRRKFLVLLAGSGAAAVLVACTPGGLKTAPAPASESYIFFNDTEAATIKAVVSRLLPGTPQDPGAAEAGAHIYIDKALAGTYFSQQQTYRRGLAALNAYSHTKFGGDFANLKPEQQDGILTDMEKGTASGFYAPGAAAFFGTLRQHTREGAFCDPVYGGNQNLAGWKMIGFPGAQFAYEDRDMAVGTDQAKIAVMTLADLQKIMPPKTESGF